ncbi:MAG: glutamate--tRNA ligase family protein [Bacteroidota bacterium]
MSKEMGDFVVRKKDGFPAYQLSSLADDLHFGVTHIVRGKDLLASSAAQFFLAQCLNKANWLGQLKYFHHPLLVSITGEKLSKSAGAKAILQGGEVQFDRQTLVDQIKSWLGNTNRPVLQKVHKFLEEEMKLSN